MEGAVYRLGDGTVAKVWRRRTPAELLLWQAYYTDVAVAGLPFATPEILRVDEVDGTAVTIERELPGRPLDEWTAWPGGPDAGAGSEDSARDRDRPDADDGVLGILRALAGVSGTAAMRALPVLDEDRPFRRDGEDFPAALAGLLARRTARSGALLRAHVPDFDRRYAAVADRLAALDPGPDTLVHGDLVAPNIHVDDTGRPVAVLDFGFLSTAGDPRFEAGVTAAILDMYGPDAAAATETRTDRYAARLGHPAEVLRLYRAAYAIATADVFSADGSDGHFAWCVRRLTCPEVTAALGL
jgi:hypothetical protein